MRTRIIKKNGKYIPQYRIVSKLWTDFLCGMFEGKARIFQFDDKAEAEQFLKNESHES
jgi:hypothetical protein